MVGVYVLNTLIVAPVGAKRILFKAKSHSIHPSTHLSTQQYYQRLFNVVGDATLAVVI